MGVNRAVCSAKLAAIVASSLALAACAAAAPTSPTNSAPTGHPPAGAAQTAVRVVDAITGSPFAGVSAVLDSRTMGVSDGAGQATIWAAQAGQYSITFSGGSATTRATAIRVPAPETTVSMIPASFDLTAFNQMFRSSQKLQRWTAAPPLVVLTRAVQFESTGANNPLVLSDQLTVDEQQQLVSDLSDGLAALTDHRFGGFASVTYETPEAGSRVLVMRAGFIIVARSKGLTSGSTYWGYGRWATASSGEVVGGNVMIDADFDAGATPYSQYRHCLRVHELGHALGYNHVTSRQSVMNSAARAEPNDWDRQAVHIAFQRAPGSVHPDSDPGSFSLNSRTGAVTWSPPIY